MIDAKKLIRIAHTSAHAAPENFDAISTVFSPISTVSWTEIVGIPLIRRKTVAATMKRDPISVFMM